MEPVCLFHDNQDHGHLGSGLKLRSFISEGLHHPPELKQHCATVTGDVDARPKVELMKNNADAHILLLTEEPKEGGREDGNSSDGSGTNGAPSRGIHALNLAEEDTPIGHEGVRGDIDDIDATDMCFDECVISNPPTSNPIKQETRLEYENTYLESLTERDGMLIESVPASSPTSFFQSEAIHVSKDSSLIGHGDAWKDLPSQQEADYHTSSTEFDLPDGQGADFIFPKEVTQDTLANDGISDQLEGAKNTQFNELPTRELTDSEENCPSSKQGRETMILLEQKNITPEYLLKDKMARVDLCLRSVLSDPITGAFLDDAMVAQCGHSFGSGSLQKVMETHVCVTCGATASPNLLVPNFALRAAVLAYNYEDHLQMTSIRGLKRRREVSEQVEGSEAKRTEWDHWGAFENISADSSRSKAIQFPFAVCDKVLIKGNKRTPERFVGRKAIITTQCLNGWYLVKTLDTDESVRLQYRSLQKLGDVEMPCTSEMEYFSEQGGDGSGSPVELSKCPTQTVGNRGLEIGSLATQRDTANGKLDQHGLEENANTACSSEGELSGPPYSSNALVNDCGVSNTTGGGTSKHTVEDLPNNQGRKIEQRLAEDGPKTSEISRDHCPNFERCAAAVDQTVSDAMVEKFRTDLLNGISTFHDESGDEQAAADVPQSETSLWVGTEPDFRDTHASNGEQVLLSKVLSTDPVGDATGGGGPTGNKDHESENDLSRTRSRRTSWNSRNSLPRGVCGHDSDPYKKVYSSWYRRRGGKGNTVVMVNPDDTVAESKEGSVRNYSEAHHGERLGSGKHGKDTKVKSTSEILHIMRRDMLTLEKQIPRSYLLNSWRSNRIRWRKAVKANCTVLELGDLVREFRFSLLLTTAGGLTDEELVKRLTTISESGDVDLLVSLWGKLYDDVYRCVESRPKSGSSLAHSLRRKLLTVEAKDVNELDLGSGGQAMSPDQMTVVPTKTDAFGDRQQKSGSDVKTLLASTLNLLQKQSRMELRSVKDALEREKRHIVAKLAKLEESYAILGSTPLGTSLTGPKPLGDGSNGQALQHRVSMPCNKKLVSGGPTVLSTPDDGETERASPAQDSDGEATDLSDSD